jgi:glycopeptide antibiotics resistance protein
MLPVRHVGFWRFFSAVILVAVLVAALSPAFWLFDNRAHALFWFQNADKWLHALTFITLALWFAGLYEKRNYWRIAVGLMLFGFVVELCQLTVSYRTADWVDIGANTAGIIVGLSVAAAGLGGWSLRFEDWYTRRNQL